jgi:hypothetical protein
MNVRPKRSKLHLEPGILHYGNIRCTDDLSPRLHLNRHQLLTVGATVHPEQQTREAGQRHDAPPLPVHGRLLGLLRNGLLKNDFLSAAATLIRRGMGQFSQWRGKKQ